MNLTCMFLNPVAVSGCSTKGIQRWCTSCLGFPHMTTSAFGVDTLNLAISSFLSFDRCARKDTAGLSKVGVSVRLEWT